MPRKPTHLRFTEDDLSDTAVKKAADKAEKATTKAEKAVDKVMPQKYRKLRPESDISAKRTPKMRFGKAKHEGPKKPATGKKFLKDAPRQTISSAVHREIAKNEEENVGIQAAHRTQKAAERTRRTINHRLYAHKMKAYDKAEKLVKKSDKANVNALFEKFKKDNPMASSNPLSRWQQKRVIRKEYAAMRAGKNGKAAASGAGKGAKKGTQKALDGLKNLGQKLVNMVNKKVLLLFGGIALLVLILAGMVSSCTAMFQGVEQVIVGTSFTAKDEDILGTESDYTRREHDLQQKISNIEPTHPGYDEYRYQLDEIGHNPYQLATYLTVKYEAYTREQVQAEVGRLFDNQYEFILEPQTEIITSTETRTGTITHTDPQTGKTWEEEYEYQVEVEYEYHILNVTLKNHSLEAIINTSGLTDNQKQRYEVILKLMGNRPGLFSADRNEG